MIEDDQRGAATFTELFDASSQLFSQRLLSLNHGLVLKATTQRLRRNHAFEWNEPIFAKNLCTMAAISHHLGDSTYLGVDLIRLYDVVGDQPFTRQRFQEVFQQRLRSTLIRHSMPQRRAEATVGSGRFVSYLDERLALLCRAKLVERVLTPSGDAPYRLTAKGSEAAIYLDLFLHNIWFSEKVPHCAHCSGRVAVVRAPVARIG